MRFTVILGIIALLITSAPCAAQQVKNSSNQGRLAVTFLDCSKNSGRSMPLRLHLFDVARRKFREVRSAPNNHQIKQLAVDLSAGAYVMDAASGDCAEEVVIQAFPGRIVHATLIGSPLGTLLGGRTSISGLLPIPGMRVAIVYKHIAATCGANASADGFAEFPAIVDGDAYYAGYVPSGEATVRIYDSSGIRWRDVATVRIEAKNLSTRNIVLNISESMLLR